jgi:hypothetical protein
MKEKQKKLELEMKDFKTGDIIIGKHGHPYLVFDRGRTLFRGRKFIRALFIHTLSQQKWTIRIYEDEYFGKRTVLRMNQIP